MLASVGLAVGALIFGLIYRRYVLLLGADRRRPAERQEYDALRNSLIGGNLAARLYARWLGVMLDRIDCLFGDAGMADRTLFPHFFWLKTPAPLWTAPALERCLLLALIYPIATILVVWAVSGHVGPAEDALHLNPRLVAWQRGLAVAMFVISMCCLWGAMRVTGWKRLVRAVIYIIAFVIAVCLSVAQAGPMVVSSAHAALPTTQIRFGPFRGGGGAALPPPITIAVAFLGTGIIAAVIAVFSAGLGALQRFRWEGAFLTLFIPGMILACVGAAAWLSSVPIWQILGPLLLFLGLLTLLNAPFDWLSLGLTRALLRRGLEPGGWWPYFLAIVDAALAAVVIVALTLAMVIVVQFYDAAGVHGGGKAVLPLDALFNGIAANPWAPEYWWIYVLLVSTMIPSLVNLGIGWTSILRGVPGLPSLLLRKIPAQGNVVKWDRQWIATVLTFQVAAGATLGVVAQVLLVIGIIGYVMPFFGLELLGMARDVAAFNLPARVGHLFGVSL